MVVLFHALNHVKVSTAFDKPDLYSIGFIFLTLLLPFYMFVLNDVAFPFKSEKNIEEEKYKLILDNRPLYPFYIKHVIKICLILLIIISFLMASVGFFIEKIFS